MKTRPILLHAILFLFFLQLLTDFIAAIYAFGLLGTSIPPELGFALLLFAPALLLLTRRPGPRLLAAMTVILFLARVLEPALDTRARLMVAGAGAAAWLMLFPLLLWRDARSEDPIGPLSMTAGLLLATLTSVMLRVWGSGVDVSATGWGQALAAGLALAGAWLWWREGGVGVGVGLGVGRDDRGEDGGRAPFWRVARLSLGLMAVLTLIYFAFAAPYVMARWTGVDAFWVLLVVLGFWGLTGLTLTWAPGLWRGRKDGMLIGMLAFLFALYWAIAVHVPDFPAARQDYPFSESIQGGAIPFFLMLLLSPVLLLGFHRLLLSLRTLQPALRQLAAAFTLASLFLLIAIFAHVFTTVYDYIPVAGPFFRNQFAWVYAGVGLIAFIGFLATAQAQTDRVRPAPRPLSILILTLTLVTPGLFIVQMARPPQPPPADALTILTYNIQQGYSESGRKNYAGQLAQIQAIQPDIIGLQESDAARIANSNDDLVRYFADALDMDSYYGPSTAAGTFGIALLSRYPILNAQTFYLYSEGEQVAALAGVIDVGWDAPVTVWVTHLGNGGPMIQQEQFLQLVGDGPRTLALGDFNFRPDSPQYALTTRHLLDSWTQKWPDWEDDRGQRPDRKIDHIFISPDWRVLDARYYPAGPSDHPAVTARLAP